jgi:hypothetical protein
MRQLPNFNEWPRFVAGNLLEQDSKKRDTRFHYYTDIRVGIWLILASLSDSIDEHDIVA